VKGCRHRVYPGPSKACRATGRRTFPARPRCWPPGRRAGRGRPGSSGKSRWADFTRARFTRLREMAAHCPRTPRVLAVRRECPSRLIGLPGRTGPVMTNYRRPPGSRIIPGAWPGGGRRDRVARHRGSASTPRPWVREHAGIMGPRARRDHGSASTPRPWVREHAATVGPRARRDRGSASTPRPWVREHAATVGPRARRDHGSASTPEPWVREHAGTVGPRARRAVRRPPRQRPPAGPHRRHDLPARLRPRTGTWRRSRPGVTLPKYLALTERVVIITFRSCQRCADARNTACCPITRQSRSGIDAVTCDVRTWQ
jgi:hypothetical protein